MHANAQYMEISTILLQYLPKTCLMLRYNLLLILLLSTGNGTRGKCLL